MRNPNKVLTSLNIKASDKKYCYERLYRNLYNSNFYLLAYQNIYNNGGSMAKGIDGETMSGMGIERIDKLIAKIRNGNYKPNPVKRQYIPKPNGKMRPLGIPSSDDKLVQEVIRLILNAIYEPVFDKCSHGFRPNRSCHTALLQIQHSYTGVKWFIEGDIKGCFDNIDHHILTTILRKRIKDEQFIGLIWKFLRAGYLENWRYHNTYSGSAQGSIISPILANIYMNELDVYMQKYKESFDKGTKRACNLEYNRKKANWHYSQKKLKKNWNSLSAQERELAKDELEKERLGWSTLSAVDYMDAYFKRLLYCRYADDFLIGVIGSKADAAIVREDVKHFLSEALKLELSMEKTFITHARQKARFLGYDVTKVKASDEAIKVRGVTIRRNSGLIKLYVPKEKWIERLLSNGMLQIKKDENGREVWKPIARKSLINLKPVEIVSRFNAEIRGLYNYYSIANNSTVLQKYSYVSEYSMYRTFATKYRSSVGKVKKQYMQNRIFSIPYMTSKGIEKRVAFYHDGFRKKDIPQHAFVDITPKPSQLYNFRPKELIVRLIKGECEWCGIKCDKPKVRQVKSMAELLPNIEWQAIMIMKRRKTLVLCNTCYEITLDSV